MSERYMAKYFQAEASAPDTVRITGPNVVSHFNGITAAQLTHVLTLMDEAYESGLATANATHQLNKLSDSVDGEVDDRPGHYQLEGVNRTDLRINGPGVWWDVTNMDPNWQRQAFIFLNKAYEAGLAITNATNTLAKEAELIRFNALFHAETNAPSIVREVYELRAPAPHELVFVFLTINFDDDTITVTPKPWLLPESGERRYPSIGELTDLFAFRNEPDAERTQAIATLIAKAAAFGAERIAAVRKARGQAPAPAPAPASAS